MANPIVCILVSLKQWPRKSKIMDEPSRWNSTQHMIERLIEVKDAIISACANSGIAKDMKRNKVLSITENGWYLIKKLNPTLKRLAMATPIFQ